MPEAAVSAYVVLFVSRGERASTVMTRCPGLAVILAVFATIVVSWPACPSRPCACR